MSSLHTTVPLETALTVKLIAFYLPQYHPTPENDEWWGKGFTEWTNVARCQPQFRGHYQPHLPADLGFYDLRLAESRAAQAALARHYGVSGFCYYHYWFSGRRLLQRPFEEVLRSGQPDFPFCLCWANENWTRSWDGREREVLLRQEYDAADDLAHIRALAPALADHRNIRVEGKPLFLVYRAGRLPDPVRTINVWQEEAARLGVGELYLCRVESLWEERGDPRPLGFDAAVEFQPDFGLLHQRWRSLWLRSRWAAVRRRARFGRGHHIESYRKVASFMRRQTPPDYPRFPGVTPGWDNSPRRPRGAAIFTDTTPEAYEAWLRAAIQLVSERESDPSRRIVFINAWNEWAEGNHLEPSQKWGCQFLEATQRALNSAAVDAP